MLHHYRTIKLNFLDLTRQPRNKINVLTRTVAEICLFVFHLNKMVLSCMYS